MKIRKPDQEISLIRGCTNPNSSNYNPNATVDDGSCIITQTIQTYTTFVKRYQFVINSNIDDCEILVDNVHAITSGNGVTPDTLIFSETELLTPKVVTVNRSGFESSDVYRIKTITEYIEKTVTNQLSNLDSSNILLNQRNTEESVNRNIIDGGISQPSIIFKQYSLVIEKQINGVFTELPLISDLSNSVSLSFNLDRAILVQPTRNYVLLVNADILQTTPVNYTLNDGTVGKLEQGINEITFNPSVHSNVKFEAVNLNPKLYSVTYITYSERNSAEFKTIDFNLALTNRNDEIRIVINKLNPVSQNIIPSININSGDVLKFNIASNDELEVPYNSFNSAKVTSYLGNTKRELQPNGTIKLTKDDFYNGVGNYVLKLQPSNDNGLLGEVKKITINVISEQYYPGPDITHINYPQTIKGADFQGTNVDFNISWQSVYSDYVNIWVGKQDDNYAIGKFAPNSHVTLNILALIKKSNLQYDETQDGITFKLLLQPSNSQTSSIVKGKLEEIFITFDKGNLTLPRPKVIDSIKNAFKKQFHKNILSDDASNLLTHYLHLDGVDNRLIATWGTDTETFSEYKDHPETGNPIKIKEEKTLVIKLYEPLPKNYQPNDQLWISKIQSIPIIDQFTIVNQQSVNCVELKPNFGLDFSDEIGYQLMDDLIASGSESSAEVVGKFISSSNFSLSDLQLTFESGSDYWWPNFVKYSSAEERVHNFMYKVKAIERYNVSSASLASGSTSGSTASITELSSVTSKINNIKKGFDSFENWMYSDTGSLTFPGAGLASLSASDSGDADTWYTGILSSAQLYDESNKNLLTNNIPVGIKDDGENSDFVLFLNMIGQHFDILWSYTKGISQSKKIEHKFESGITDKLVYQMLTNLGWEPKSSLQSQFLWEFAFGNDKDGTSVSSMSGKNRQNQIWRRILNNLPYLYKHKGTRRALHAVMSCYGVPSSMLTIMEFGGPDPGESTTFTYDDRSAAINMNVSQSILVPWKNYTPALDFPNAIELRVNTQYSQSVSQNIITSDGWELNILSDTGSLGKVQLIISSSGTRYSASTDSIPLFGSDYTQITVNKTLSGSDETFQVFVKESSADRVRNSGSCAMTFTSNSSAWKLDNELIIGAGFSGSIDEFRLWSSPLSESRIINHTLLPDAIDGNHVSASTEDLLFRLDFEYPKDRTNDTSIKSVAINRTYAQFATASNFPSASSYPYQYTPYERTITADVPTTGMSYGNKIRFESQTLLSDLNYRSRATKKSFDQSPIDSDRLGLFFSPTKEINMDIIKSIGKFRIDNYIGDPSDEYEETYSDLNALRNYYFDRYTLNIYEYIQLVRYIDKSLFDTLESLVPARAKVSSGLLIEPHILERSKVKWSKPTAVESYHETLVDANSDVVPTSTYDVHTSTLDISDGLTFVSTNPQYATTITSSADTVLYSTYDVYETQYSSSGMPILLTEMVINSGSDMGGVSISIDSQITGTLQGGYDSDVFTVIGQDPNSISVAGAGLYGIDGVSVITKMDKFGNFVKERNKVYVVTENYRVDVPNNIDLNDSSLGTELVTDTLSRKIVVITSYSGSVPTVGNDITNVTVLNGHLDSHYNNSFRGTGLDNSFYNGAKQTQETTIDGGDAIEITTTNPNTLRVSDTGRGAGQPILTTD